VTWRKAQGLERRGVKVISQVIKTATAKQTAASVPQRPADTKEAHYKRYDKHATQHCSRERTKHADAQKRVLST